MEIYAAQQVVVFVEDLGVVNYLVALRIVAIVKYHWKKFVGRNKLPLVTSRMVK